MNRTLLFTIGLISLNFSQINAQASMNFDGVDDVVTAPNPSISGSASRTVEAWVKTTKNSLPSGSGGQGQSVIVDWGTASPNGNRFTLNLLFNNSVRLEVGGNGLSGSTAVNDGNWHHVAATYNHGVSPSVALYVDGNLTNSGDLTVPVSTSTSGDLRIGQRVDGINMFEGSIDEVRIWNFAKTQTEIQADMYKEFCSTQTGLVTYYKFNEGTPAGNNSSMTTINDYSGNSNNGTATGFAMTGTTSNYDSSPTLALTTIDNTLTVGSTFIEANQTGGYYKWYECGTSNLIAEGTSPVLTGIPNGNYYAIINYNGCIAQSNCETFTLGVTDINLVQKSVQVYPNPSSGEYNLVLNDSSEATIAVYDTSGKLILKRNLKANREANTIHIDGSKGTYFLQLENEKGEKEQIKLIKN